VLNQLKTRLLTIGPSTTTILSIYIKAIDVLKLLDPSTLMLQEVSEPIKQYLYTREETLRCLVNTIFDKEQRLFEQLDN
jgi:anaphase-promoting complex subunit 2